MLSDGVQPGDSASLAGSGIFLENGAKSSEICSTKALDNCPRRLVCAALPLACPLLLQTAFLAVVGAECGVARPLTLLCVPSLNR